MNNSRKYSDLLQAAARTIPNAALSNQVHDLATALRSRGADCLRLVSGQQEDLAALHRQIRRLQQRIAGLQSGNRRLSRQVSLLRAQATIHQVVDK